MLLQLTDEISSTPDVELVRHTPDRLPLTFAGTSGSGEYITLYVAVPAVFGAARQIRLADVVITGPGASSIQALHVELLDAPAPDATERHYALELRRVDGPGGEVTVGISPSALADPGSRDRSDFSHCLHLGPWQSTRLFDLAAEDDAAVTVDLPDDLELPERASFSCTRSFVEVDAVARTVTLDGLGRTDDHYAYIEIHDAVGTVVGTIEIFVCDAGPR